MARKRITLNVGALHAAKAKHELRLLDVKDATGLSYSHLVDIFKGRTNGVRFTTAEALCKCLDLQPEDLLTWT